MISLLSGGSLTGFRMTAIEEKRLGTYTIAHSGYTVGWPFCIEEEKVGDCLVPSRKEDDAPLIPNGCQHPPLYPQFGHHSIDYYYYYYTMAVMVVSILFICWLIQTPFHQHVLLCTARSFWLCAVGHNKRQYYTWKKRKSRWNLPKI